MARLRSGDIVQRDLYSAFLLEHIDTESLQYNMETLNSAFPAFLKMHENTKTAFAGGWKFSSCKHWILSSDFLGARHSLIKELPRKR